MTSATRRLGVMIAIVLLLAGLVGAWWQSTGTPVARARPIPIGALRIAVFGDSIAFGWGTPHPARDGLAALLAARFAASRPGSTLVTAAFPGSTIREIALLQLRHVSGPVQLVLAISGGNDVQQASPPWRIAADEASMIESLRARYPEASLWVTDLPDVSLRPSMPRWSRVPFGLFIALEDAVLVRAARAHGAHVLSLSAISREPEANRAPYVSSDGLHPSAAGYAKLAQALWPSFEAALRTDATVK